MSAVAACSARGIPFAVQMTVNARNEGEIEQAALAAAELGAKQVSFGMTQATGSDADRELYLSPAALDRIRDRVERLSTLLHVPVTLAEGFRRGWRFHVCEPFRSEVLHVTPHGKLNLCCNHSGRAGERRGPGRRPGRGEPGRRTPPASRPHPRPGAGAARRHRRGARAEAGLG